MFFLTVTGTHQGVTIICLPIGRQKRGLQMKGRWKKGNMRIQWENPLFCTKYTVGAVIMYNQHFQKSAGTKT